MESQPPTISTAKAVELILQYAGQIFTVDFLKRTTGELRTMRCRLGTTVKKGLKGGSLSYSPFAKGLLTAYIMPGDENRSDDPAENRRMIPVDGMRRLVIAGEEYQITE